MSPSRTPPAIETVAELLSTELAGNHVRPEVLTQKPIIAKALGELERSLREFAHLLQDAPFAVVFRPVEERIGKDVVIVGYERLDHGPAIEAAITAYCTLDLEPDDPVKKSVIMPGALGVLDPRIIDHAREVNRLKTVLKDAFKPINNHRVLVTKRVNGEKVVKKIAAGLYVLRQIQRSSLNRLGAYRKIPLIRTEGKYAHPPTPVSVRFTESFSRSLPRATVGELIDHADAIGRKTPVKLLQASGIPMNEYLYSPKDSYPRLRANLMFPAADPKKQGPMNYMGGMPILFWRQKSMAWPTVSGPTARKATAPRGRRRIPLCDKPVIKGPAYYRRLNPSDRELK